ncbi:MAG: hypothetical protein IJS89_00445 [Bacteroidaceae bacterium]|nr:hypothetical protein [Bacteroidaceae bacterium]
MVRILSKNIPLAKVMKIRREYFALSENIYIPLRRENRKTFMSIMVRTNRSKEEMAAAFKHAIGARKAFEDLVKGRIDKTEFERQGYKLMQFN